MDERFIVFRAIRNISDLSTAMTQQNERSIKENVVKKGKYAEMDNRICTDGMDEVSAVCFPTAGLSKCGFKGYS